MWISIKKKNLFAGARAPDTVGSIRKEFTKDTTNSHNINTKQTW